MTNSINATVVEVTKNMSCHGYEGVMSVLWTPLQVKCYPYFSLCSVSNIQTWKYV